VVLDKNNAMAQRIAMSLELRSTESRHSSSIFTVSTKNAAIVWRCNAKDLGHVLRCFLFLETWRDPIDWCPNGQTWSAVQRSQPIKLDAYRNNNA
jgi:hypothetical protein